MNKLLMKTIITFGLVLMTSLSFADPVWIDVRTAEEYIEDHIPGDNNIPLASVNPESMAEIFGKNTEINLYCRSGGRAGQAVELLQTAGFTNVHNVGGINDVRDLRSLEH